MVASKINLNSVKGMNRVDPQWNLTEEWAYLIQNGYVRKNSGGKTVIEQRYGTEEINGSGGETNFDYIHVENSIYGKKTTPGGLGTWRKWNTSVSGGWVNISADAPSFFENVAYWNNKAYFASTSLGPKDDSGTLLTADTLINGVTFQVAHQNRYWVANASTVYGSRVNDATSANAFSTENDSVDLDIAIAGTSEFIMGLESFDRFLVIFTSTNVYIYDTPTIWENIDLVKTLPFGLLSENAYTRVGNDIIFATYAGVKSLSASLSDTQLLDIGDLTTNISLLWDEEVGIDYVQNSNTFGGNVNFAPRISLTYIEELNHLLIIIIQKDVDQTGEELDVTMTSSNVYVYSFDTGTVTGIYDFDIGSKFMTHGFAVRKGQGSNLRGFLHTASAAPLSYLAGRIYLVDNEGGLYSMRRDTYQDDGTAIVFKFQPGYLGANAYDMVEGLKELHIIIKSRIVSSITITVNFQPIVENGLAAASSSSTTHSLLAGVNYIDHNLGMGRFRLLDLTIESATTNNHITLGEVILRTETEGNK